MNKLLKWVIDLFNPHCPDCGGDMRIIYYGSSDPNIYECKKCGKWWVWI